MLPADVLERLVIHTLTQAVLIKCFQNISVVYSPKPCPHRYIVLISPQKTRYKQEEAPVFT